MPVTQVGICNSALIKIGADRISSITENTKPAILCNTLWNYVRDTVLRDHPWRFATARAEISPTANTPTFEYDYEYDIPNDCIRVLGITNDIDGDCTEEIKFSVEDSKLLCDEPTLYLKYTYRHENYSAWDSAFAEAMAWRLAMELSIALAQKESLFKLMQEGYRAQIAYARSYDSMEGTPPIFVADSWINARK